jgi:hypothetical protein
MRFEVKVVTAGVAVAPDRADHLASCDVTSVAFPGVEAHEVELVARFGRQPDDISTELAFFALCGRPETEFDPGTGSEGELDRDLRDGDLDDNMSLRARAASCEPSASTDE